MARQVGQPPSVQEVRGSNPSVGTMFDLSLREWINYVKISLQDSRSGSDIKSAKTMLVIVINDEFDVIVDTQQSLTSVYK